VFRLVRGNQHILDVLDVLHRDRLALRIHDGAFSAMDLTARHPRTGELLSTVKFMVQTLAAAGELQRDLQRELTYDGLRAAEAKGSKGGRRPAVAAETTGAVRTAYLEGRSIAVLARDPGASRGAIRTAVADLLPEHTAADPDAPAPELPVTLDMPGKVADFLRAVDLEPAERAALDQGTTVRRGQGYTLRVTAVPAVHRHLLARCQPLDGRPGRPGCSGCSGCSGPAQGPPRVREPRQHTRADRTMINLSANRCTDVPRGRDHGLPRSRRGGNCTAPRSRLDDLGALGVPGPHRVRLSRGSIRCGWVRRQTLAVQRGHQIRPGPGYPGADGANRAATDSGGVGVAQVQHLGEHEGLPAVRVQGQHQLAQQYPLVHSGQRRYALGEQVPIGLGGGAGPANHTADVIGGGASGDRQQPGAAGGSAGEPGQRAQCPQVGLLCQVVRFAGANQAGQEPVHVPLGGPDERDSGFGVPPGAGQRRLGDLVIAGTAGHGASLPTPARPPEGNRSANPDDYLSYDVCGLS